MTEQPPSWQDLNRTEPAPRQDSEFDAVCAQVFAAAPGQRLLDLLRKQHFDGPFNLLAPERALAIRITRQQFVRDLELACERGLKAKQKPKAT